MISEFLWLTLLTLNEDDREALRGKLNKWLKEFLPKLERESTRTAKCRLIASVERHEFENHLYDATDWQFFKFVENKGVLYDKDKKQLDDKGEFEATSFQKKILRENSNLSDVLIGRFEIKEENGEWKLKNELKDKLISEGGEALVFSEKFGEVEMAVRVHVFDPFLFTKKFGVDRIKLKTHLISGEFIFFLFLVNFFLDFESAVMADGRWQRSDGVVPIHENVIQNYANIELFDSGDENEEDCLGWITIMEKCERNLRTELKRENLNLNERKKIATGIKAGLDYLRKIGIEHKDQKLENFLLIGDVVKICDFGLVQERSGRNGFRKLGYTRRGSKYENDYALCKFAV
jgi:hypothetical protein